MFDLTDTKSILDEFNALDESGSGLYQEDPENNLILCEAIIFSELNSEELADLSENTKELETMIGDNLISEKTIIKLDKKAKLSRAEQQAVLLIAKEKGDKDFFRLVRVWKMRKFLLNKLNKKYGGRAKSRARQMVANMGKSKSKTAKTAANRATIRSKTSNVKIPNKQAKKFSPNSRINIPGFKG